MEIKAAIERLSPAEKAELQALVWPRSDGEASADSDTPPRVREKLAQSAEGRFLLGDRANIGKVLASLE
jgi:hypothetical protein